MTLVSKLAVLAVVALAVALPGAARAEPPPLPPGALGAQLAWVLDSLDPAHPTTAAAVRAHFSPEYMALSDSPSAFAAALRQTAAERGPVRLLGYAHEPTATQAVALIRTRSGRGAVRLEVGGRRITALEVTAPPPRLGPGDRHSGRFDVDGREVYLHCVGRRSPTVVFEESLIEYSYAVQRAVAQTTRACSYDRANARWGRSDPVATPRTATDVVDDLHELLAVAGVPGPYVLVGHSNDGLFVQLYASRYPDAVAGLVLLDAVHPDYYDRDLALLETLLPADVFEQVRERLLAMPPRIIDPEQLDMPASLREAQAALAAAPIRPMPLTVIERGIAGPPPPPPGSLEEARERLWHELQADLVRLVPGARHVVARRSGHSIVDTQPGLVASEIRRVVAAVRGAG